MIDKIKNERNSLSHKVKKENKEERVSLEHLNFTLNCKKRGCYGYC